ncbi:riboflavin kinase [Coemansia sp. RSA 1821]|nr:riboflavin kinase [Coemansia sp. RSA 1821]
MSTLEQRPLIAGGDTLEAPFPIFIEGKVVEGFGRGGKQLGIPTANLPPHVAETLDVSIGVYYGWAALEGDTVRPMVMSLGWNPYFKNEKKSAEVHIIHNYDSDFYGKLLKVAILAYVRPEQDYRSLDDLIKDIKWDIRVAQESLKRPAYDQSERELFIFNWLTQLEQYLKDSSNEAAIKEALKGSQEQLERVLLEVVFIKIPQQQQQKQRGWLSKQTATAETLLGPVPRPSLVTCNLVASCLVLIYERGQMHQMGLALLAIQHSLTQSNPTEQQAALIVAGQLFEQLGNKAGFRLLSCFGDFVTAALRIVNSGSSSSLKAAALRMLPRLLAGGGSKMLGEQHARDMLKCIRGNLAHRSPMVVMAAAWALEALTRVHRQMDRDAVVAQLVRLVGMRVAVVRQSLARALACAVATSVDSGSSLLLEHAGSPSVPAVRSSADINSRSVRAASVATSTRRDALGRASSDLPSPPHTQTAQSTVTSPQISKSRQIAAGPRLWPLTQALDRLRVAFRSGSRELCVGIADAYRMVWDELGSSGVASNYAHIVRHTLSLLPTSAEATEPHRAWGIRSLCEQILEAARLSLSSSSDMEMARQTLWDVWIGDGASESFVSSDAIQAVLCEWRHLGPLGAGGQEKAVPLERWLASPQEQVRRSAASALYSFTRRGQLAIAPLLTRLVSRLQQSSAQAMSVDYDSLLQQQSKCLGLATAICVLLAAARDRQMHVPMECVEWVYAIAERQLQTAYGLHDPVVAVDAAVDSAADPAQVMPSILPPQPPPDPKHGRLPRAAAGGLQAGRGGRLLAIERSSVQLQSGWALMIGLARLGQWREEWAAVWWPRALPADGAPFISPEMSWPERNYLLKARCLASAHALVCLRQSPSLAAPLAMSFKAALQFADNALEAPIGTSERAEVLVATSLHVQLRTRVMEYVALLGTDLYKSQQTVVLQPALRLAERVLGGSESLQEQIAAQLACSGDADGRGHRGSVDKASGGDSSAWGYEAKVGITTLLADRSRGSRQQDPLEWLPTLVSQGSSLEQQRVVDAGVQLVGRVFPYLPEQSQLSLLDALVTRLNKLPFNSHRHMAVLVNTVMAAYCAVSEADLQKQQLSLRVSRSLVEAARAALMVPDPLVREVAGSVLGSLARAVGKDASLGYVSYVLQELSALAIRSRDRFARAGAAVALGSLYAHAGSIAAGSGSLKQVVAMLHSLARDRDPLVHTWALGALADAALAAGYMFEPYARTTFQLVLQLVLSDSHKEPFYSSLLWLRGREHAPASIWDAASLEQRFTLSNPVGKERRAVHWDAALVHPNSSAYHGLPSAADDGDADGLFVCTRNDKDSMDARAALGRLTGALLLVLGPELQMDEKTRSRVSLVLGELRRALPSVTGSAPAVSTAGAAVDPDARWETVVEYVAAMQRQFLFSPPSAENVREFVCSVLRPCLQVRRLVYYGAVDSQGLRQLHIAGARALESTLRLYGDCLQHDVLCAVAWEALWLYNDSREGAQESFAREVLRLVRTVIGLSCGSDGLLLAMTETLCAAFAKQVSRDMPQLQNSEGNEHAEGKNMQQFSAATRQLVVSALLSILAYVQQHLPSHPSAPWHSHQLLPLLPDMLRVAHSAASTIDCEFNQLAVLGLNLVQAIIEQFALVEDPAVAGDSVLKIYQAQLQSSFMAKLTDATGEDVLVRIAAMQVAGSYVVSGLIDRGDRMGMTRVLRLLAPQPLFAHLPFMQPLESNKRRPRGMSVGSMQDNTEMDAPETPQLHVILRLTVLAVWSRIFKFIEASERHSPVLQESLSMHFSLLAHMWLGSIRDAAVLGSYDQWNKSVFAELNQLQGTEHLAEDGLGLGLVLGLESTYLPAIRHTLNQWYRHYLPEFLQAISQMLLSWPEQAQQAVGLGDWLQLPLPPGLVDDTSVAKVPRSLVLVLGFAVQQLGQLAQADYNVPCASNGDPYAQSIRDQLVPAALADANDAHSTPNNGGRRLAEWLLDAIYALVSTDAYNIPMLFAATASMESGSGQASWLVVELWKQAVSRPLGYFKHDGLLVEKSLRVGAMLLDKLKSVRATSGQNLLYLWTTNSQSAFSENSDSCLQDESSDAALQGWIKSLSEFGRLAVSDAMAIWRATAMNSSTQQLKSVSGSLEILAYVFACESAAGCSNHRVSLWMSLWMQSLGGILGRSEQAALSLTKFVYSSSSSAGNQPSGIDDLLLASDETPAVLVSVVNSVLLQVLAADNDAISSDTLPGNSEQIVPVLSVVAQLLASSGQSWVSDQVRLQFTQTFISQIQRATDLSGSLLLPLLDIPAILASASSAIASQTLVDLAPQSITELAKLAYAHLDQQDSVQDGVFEKVLSTLVRFASVTTTKHKNKGSDMVLASILMLLLSMVDTRECLPQVADAILSLATMAPDLFKTIVVQLSAKHKEAKQRLELAIRSKANAGSKPLADKPAAFRDDSELSMGASTEPSGPSGIVLKSDFGI